MRNPSQKTIFLIILSLIISVVTLSTFFAIGFNQTIKEEATRVQGSIWLMEGVIYSADREFYTPNESIDKFVNLTAEIDGVETRLKELDNNNLYQITSMLSIVRRGGTDEVINKIEHFKSNELSTLQQKLVDAISTPNTNVQHSNYPEAEAYNYNENIVTLVWFILIFVTIILVSLTFGSWLNDARKKAK